MSKMKRKFLQRALFGAVALALAIPGGLVYQQYQHHIPQAQFIPMARGGHLALMMDMNAGAREKLLEFLAQYNR